MSRWLYVGGALVALLLIAALMFSPSVHGAGNVDCSRLDGDAPGEPRHGTYESDMYAEAGDTDADCPIDDAAGMGNPTADG